MYFLQQKQQLKYSVFTHEITTITALKWRSCLSFQCLIQVDNSQYVWHTFWCWYFLLISAWCSLGPHADACINKHNITRTWTQFKYISTVIKEITNAKYMCKILNKNNEFLLSHQDKHILTFKTTKVKIHNQSSEWLMF
jgi:hypothetical protein